MTTIQRIAKNTASLFAAEAVIVGLGLVLSILIARTLGEVAFGFYSFALAFTGIFAIFLDLGFNRLIVRDVARDHSLAAKYLGNIAVVKGVLAVVVFVVMALVVRTMSHPPDAANLVLIFGLYVILVAFGDVFRSTFRAFERMEYEALTSAILRATIAAIGISVVLLGYGLTQIAWGFVIGGVVYVAVSCVVCRQRFATPKVERDLSFFRSAVKTALPLSVISIATVMYFRIDSVMLSVMKGAAEVGWYSAAHSLVFALNPVPVLFAAALFPSMSAAFVSRPGALATMYERALRYLLLLGLPLAVGTMLISNRIVLLLYGSAFAPSIGALQILAWHIPLFFLYTIIGNVLIAMNKHYAMAIGASGGAVLNIILNLVLIPRFSYIGAAIATVATEAALLAAYCRMVSGSHQGVNPGGLMVRPLVACGAMGAFIYYFGGTNLALLIVGAALIYVAALWLIRGLTRDDLVLLRRVMRRHHNRNR